MTTENIDYLIVGGGLAAAKCAAKLRAGGPNGRIMIVGAELRLPYNRPPLSKGLLLGYDQPDRVFAFTDKFYRENNIETVLGVPAVSLDVRAETVELSDGRRFTYRKLLISTGTSPVRLQAAGSELENIFYLRTLDDSLRIREAMGKSDSAVVVGAGFIGMELAAAFRENDIKTTMLVREKGLFTKLGSEQLTAFFRDLYERHGVEIIYEDEVDRFVGETRVEKVVTKGGRELPADIVAVGIGVKANTDWLEGSGLELDRGVVVDEYLRAEPNIYAAGDLAVYFDPVFRKRRRVEHWDNAIKQGELAALNMLGVEKPCDYVAYFFSDVFEVSWEWLGDNSDVDGTVTRGALDGESAMIFYLKDGRLKAAFLLRPEPEDKEWVERTIKTGANLSAAAGQLADPSVPLDEISI